MTRSPDDTERDAAAPDKLLLWWESQIADTFKAIKIADRLPLAPRLPGGTDAALIGERLIEPFRKFDRFDETKMKSIIDQIIQVIVQSKLNDAPLVSYRPSNRQTARQEIGTIRKQAEMLLTSIRGLHEPAIVALADQHFMRSEIESALERLAAACRRAEFTRVPEKVKSPGRTPSHRARALALLAILGYEQCTGNNTRLSGKASGLVELLRQIFELAGVQGNAKAAIEAAQKQRR